MARNEEKQLARLNRFYLSQQKEEELKKNPPRPRLDSLHTADDIKKWLPSILKDIDFYVKQMEVSCYPQRQIDEFNRRIDGLRGEYKAYLHKLRSLTTDLEATPWTDRPYSGKRKRKETKKDEEIIQPNNNSTSVLQSTTNLTNSFIPLPTPVLANDSFYVNCFGYEKEKVPVTDYVHEDSEDQPLTFNFHCSQNSKPDKTAKKLGGCDNGHKDTQDLPLEFNFQSAEDRADASDQCQHPVNSEANCFCKLPNCVDADDTSKTFLRERSDTKNCDKPSNGDASFVSTEQVSSSQSVSSILIPYSDSSSSDDEES